MFHSLKHEIEQQLAVAKVRYEKDDYARAMGALDDAKTALQELQLMVWKKLHEKRK